MVLNLHRATPRRLFKIQITQSSAEYNSFPELWPFPKIWAGTTFPAGAKCMTNPCLSKLPQKRAAAARSYCKAGTHSLNSECKHRFIIRLFFWVTQPMPWLHWIKIKAQYFTDHLPFLTRAAACALQWEGAPRWGEAHKEAVRLLSRGPNHSLGWVGAETESHRPPAGSHCQCPHCRALPEEDRERWRSPRQEEHGHKPSLTTLLSAMGRKILPLLQQCGAGPK